MYYKDILIKLEIGLTIVYFIIPYISLLNNYF